MSLRLDWCDAKAARYACEHWHYSKCVPGFQAVRVGVWEGGHFIGVIMFGPGATPEIGAPFGLTRLQVAELVRVALRRHLAPVSRMLSIGCKMLSKRCSGSRICVSFADSAQGHYGGIYQAAGWHYLGASVTHVYKVRGKLVHPKTLHSRYGVGGQSVPWLRSNVDKLAERVMSPPKHKYAKAFDLDSERLLVSMSKPYPKCVRSVGSDTSGNQPEEGGATPTRTLSHA